MTTESPSEQPSRYPGLEPVHCPKCQQNLARIPRTTMDRMVGIFRPVKRYRCRNFACHWEGTLRAGNQQSPVASETAIESAPRDSPSRSTRSRKGSIALIVSLVLVIAGVAGVMAFAPPDVFGVRDTATSDLRDARWLASTKLKGGQGSQTGGRPAAGDSDASAEPVKP